MLIQTQFVIPEILRWGHTGRFWEKCDFTSSAQSLIGYSVAHFGHFLMLIVQISHRMVKDLSKQ